MSYSLSMIPDWERVIDCAAREIKIGARIAVPVLLPFARQKRLQMFGDDMVKHGLLGMLGTIRLSATKLAGAFLKGCRFLHETLPFAGGVPSACS